MPLISVHHVRMCYILGCSKEDKVPHPLRSGGSQWLRSRNQMKEAIIGLLVLADTSNGKSTVIPICVNSHRVNDVFLAVSPTSPKENNSEDTWKSPNK